MKNKQTKQTNKQMFGLIKKALIGLLATKAVNPLANSVSFE